MILVLIILVEAIRSWFRPTDPTMRGVNTDGMVDADAALKQVLLPESGETAASQHSSERREFGMGEGPMRCC
jgi:hypothetical protein